MSTNITWFGAWRKLWARAPLWRSAVLLATVATALFVRLAPDAGHSQRAAASDDLQAVATYTAQASPKAEPTPQPTPAAPTAPTAPAAPAAPAAQDQARTTAPAPEAPVAQARRPEPARTRQAAPEAPREVPLALSRPAGPAYTDPAQGTGAKAPMGKVFRDTFEVDGRRLPLPPGNWTVLSDIRGNRPDQTVASYFLGRIERQRLAGAIVIQSVAVKTSPANGFPATRFCEEGNALYVVNESNEPNGSQSCWLMHNIFTPPWTHWDDRNVRIGQAERAAAGEMSIRGISYPQDFVVVEFHRAEKASLLNVMYLFSPEQEHINASPASTYRDSDWYGANIARDPARVAYVGRLRDWGTNWWIRFKQAFASVG
jgi:hypothetical protein